MGCVGSVVGILALSVLGFMAIDLVFAPWSYKLGGHFHAFPSWTGWGQTNSSVAGGEYLMYISLEPSPGSFNSPGTFMTGLAWICTPEDETLVMHVGVQLPRTHGFDTLGKPVHVYMDYWGGLFPSFRTDRRPYLDFYGQFTDGALVLDDHRSISQAFLSDGTVYKGKGSRPKGGDLLHLTLNEGSYGGFKAACSAKPHSERPPVGAAR